MSTITIDIRTKRTARSAANIDGKKCSLRKANELVSGHIPKKSITMDYGVTRLIYEI